MKLAELRDKFKIELLDTYGEEESLSFFYQLTEHLLNLKRIDVATNPNQLVDVYKLPQFESALLRLKNEEPIQYIIGTTEFYGLNFKVTPETLIPRPETEELVDWIISDFKSSEQKNLLDIGTGSGCIAIALKKHLIRFKIKAWDVSAKALTIAKENAELNDTQIEFNKVNILNVSTDLKFDIIVSNPPYVRQQEKLKMKNNVLSNEPHLALFVEDDNPLIFYKAILEFAAENLNSKGVIYLEINEYLSEEMLRLFKNNGYNNVEMRKDLFNKDRMLKAIKP